MPDCGRARGDASSPKMSQSIRGNQNFKGRSCSAPLFGKRPTSDFEIRKIVFAGQFQIFLNSQANLLGPQRVPRYGSVTEPKLVEPDCVRVNQISSAPDYLLVAVYKKEMPTLFIASHVETSVVVDLAWLNSAVAEIGPRT